MKLATFRNILVRSELGPAEYEYTVSFHSPDPALEHAIKKATLTGPVRGMNITPPSYIQSGSPEEAP
jgi:hypothetical protein